MTADEKNEYYRKWREKNRDKFNQYHRDYYKNNTEKCNINNLKYREYNNDLVKNINRKYRDVHKDDIQKKLKECIGELQDRYVRARLKDNGFKKEDIEKYPELIKTQRLIINIKRLCRTSEN